MELQNRARFYARVTALLYSKRNLRGRLVTANRGARFLSLGIRLADPLKLDAALSIAEPLALATNTAAVIAQRRPDMPGLVSYQFELRQGYWQSYTRADVTGLGVGLGEARKQVDFAFEPPHCLVAGTTDSGKSETVKSIMAGLFTTYAPNELGAVICDPHRDYDEFQNVAHLRAPVASSPEAIDTALTWAGQELTRRRHANERDARRLVVVIDEAEDYLDEKRLAVVQRIAGEARKFRIHLIISTRRPTQKNMPNVVHLANNRFVGLVADARESAFLTGQAGMACHLLTGKGDFVHVAGASQERLQVALATWADFARLPRAEIVAPDVEPEDTPRILNIPAAPGRPPTEIEPLKLAHYLWYGPDRISISRAREALGLARYAHYAHRDFAKTVIEEIKRLRATTKEVKA